MSGDDRTFMLRRAKSPTFCHTCGDAVSTGGDFTALTGLRHPETGKPYGEIRMCTLCAVLYMPKPDNLDEFYNPPAAPTAREMLELIDSGLCDAHCALARDHRDGCECRCSGKYHGELRLLLALFESSATHQTPTSSDDVAALAALDPPPQSVRDARERLKWNNARTVVAMRAWRNSTREDQS